MTELEQLPNIGRVLASCLRRAGIESAEELQALGAERAFERLRNALPQDACMSKLYAIADSMGERWHDLPPEQRARLAALARPR